MNTISSVAQVDQNEMHGIISWCLEFFDDRELILTYTRLNRFIKDLSVQLLSSRLSIRLHLFSEAETFN